MCLDTLKPFCEWIMSYLAPQQVTQAVGQQTEVHRSEGNDMSSIPSNPHRKSLFGAMDDGHVPLTHRAGSLELLVPSIPFKQETSVEGYCRPISVFPGDNIDFYVSALVDYQVAYLKLSELVSPDAGLPGGRNALLGPYNYTQSPQNIPKDAYSIGCNWNASYSLTAPNWGSGIYAAECRGSDGTSSYIVFIVKPLPSKKSDFALLANTNTWNAYNNWGGYSRYDASSEITLTSFERPNPFTSPYLPFDYLHPCHLTRAEGWILAWLNANGFLVDVYSDYDFHSGITDMDKYKALILSTHPEYWSIEMLDNLERYLNGGGSLLYLGGNGIFEKIQYSDSGSGLIFLDGKPQSRNNLYFRNLQPPRPEREILGVAFRYDNYFSATAPYCVQEAGASHRFFSGTELKAGDLIGHFGICGAASGREMDTSDCGTTADEKLIVSAWLHTDNMDPEDHDRGDPPSKIQVLAKGTNQGSVSPGRKEMEGPHSAHMTYYDHTGGGFVLSAGSFLFGGSLVLDSSLQKIIKNALNDRLPTVEPAECVQIRADIAQRRTTIRDLQEEREALDPRNSRDLRRINEINAQISTLHEEIAALEQQATTLGCS